MTILMSSAATEIANGADACCPREPHSIEIAERRQQIPLIPIMR